MSNLKKIEGGVTTPQGFTAGAVYTAIKKRENKKPDVAVLYSDLPWLLRGLLHHEQVLRSSGHP